MSQKSLLGVACVALLLSACASKNASLSTGEYCREAAADGSGAGRKVVLQCDGKKILNSAEAKSLLATDIPVSLGKVGGVMKSDDITRQSSNGTFKSDEDACVRAYINAAIKFQNTARKLGARKVGNFHSYLDRKPEYGGQFKCEAGTWHGRVVMRADYGR